MKIIEKKLDEIKPYDNNPRINDEAVPAVAESIRQFGFRVPMLIDRDNVIVAGHTRYEAAKELGIKNVPCIIVDKLTPEDVRQFRIVDNKTQELAKWDFAALADELEAIPEINMDAFGFAAFNNESDGDNVTSALDENEEIDLDDFADESFDHECPECGFKWNE